MTLIFMRSAGLAWQGMLDKPADYSDGLERPALVLHSRFGVGAFNAVGHQPDDLDVTQHSANFVVQAQLLLGAEALHAIERRVHMIGQALRLLPAGVVAALWSAFTV
jgi:hypothetical protein